MAQKMDDLIDRINQIPKPKQDYVLEQLNEIMDILEVEVLSGKD